MKPKRITLKSLIRETLAAYAPGTRFSVYAFELWGNPRDGFDCNDGWRIANDADPQDVETAALARWEIFRLNYARRARVSDITDTGSGAPYPASLEVDCLPFLEIRPIA